MPSDSNAALREGHYTRKEHLDNARNVRGHDVEGDAKCEPNGESMDSPNPTTATLRTAGIIRTESAPTITAKSVAAKEKVQNGAESEAKGAHV